jgi:hypothetical protein
MGYIQMLYLDKTVTPAALLRTRFPVYALKGIPILAPTVSLIAHISKEVIGPMGFMMTGFAALSAPHSAN